VFAMLWKRRRLLPPINSSTAAARRLRSWSVALTAAAIWEMFAIPFVLSFPVERELEFLSIGWLVDGCCWLDVFLTFRTAYFTRENELVGDASAIARRYARGSLALDILASLPLEVCAVHLGVPSTAIKACRMNRLLRLRRLKTIHGRQIKRLSRLSRLALLWLGMLMLSHWSACVWWALGNAELAWRLESENVSSVAAESNQAPRTIDGLPERRPWVLRPMTPGSLVRFDLDDRPLGQAYWSSFYWSLCTLVKQKPSTPPETLPELGFTAFALLVGALCYAVLVGEATAIVQVSEETPTCLILRAQQPRRRCTAPLLRSPLRHSPLLCQLLTCAPHSLCSSAAPAERLA
jgi:hypothetical protein